MNSLSAYKNVFFYIKEKIKTANADMISGIGDPASFGMVSLSIPHISSKTEEVKRKARVIHFKKL